jgi:hypothetical protein
MLSVSNDEKNDQAEGDGWQEKIGLSGPIGTGRVAEAGSPVMIP